MSSPHGSPYRGGMPKERANNGDSSSSDSEAVWPGGAYINLTPREKKIRSNTLKTRTKVYGLCCICATDVTGDCQRVELAVPVTALPKKTVLKYDGQGCARMHSTCWNKVQNSLKRSYKSKKDIELSCVEKSLLKEASKSVEYYDSMMSIGWEAIRIARMLTSSRHCIAFTGAGISTAAGIGDYRGKQGKWTSCDIHDFLSDMAIPNEEGEAEITEEEGVEYEQLRPTYTHEALLKLVEEGYIKHVISQNGDGIHKLSGLKNNQLSELHGNVYEEYCESCGKRYSMTGYVLDDSSSQYYEEMEDEGHSDVKKPRHAKRCSQCGLNHRTGRRCAACSGHLLDTIINFGDDLEEHVLSQAEHHAERADLVLSLGTTMAVTPANKLVTCGVKPTRLVICNRQSTEHDKICRRKQEGEELGSRVFGDCDVLMKCLMSLLLNTNDLIKWESQREQRMEEYNAQRNGTLRVLETSATPGTSSKSGEKEKEKTGKRKSKQTQGKAASGEVQRKSKRQAEQGLDMGRSKRGK